MIGVLMAAAILAAVGVLGWRRWQRARVAARRPGASVSRPLRVQRFDQMDRLLQHRRCECGEGFRLMGEGSRQSGVQRFRVVHLVCPDCGREETVYFDVTRVFH